MESRRQFAVVFAVVGILTIMGGANYAYNQISFLSRCEKASGTVVDLLWETVTDEDGTHEYSYPVIEFTNTMGAGGVKLAKGRVGSNPPEYVIGDVVDILYDPQDPEYVYRDDFWDIWMGPTIAASLGSAFIMVALLISRTHDYGS